MKVKRGTGAIDQVQITIDRVLSTLKGKKSVSIDSEIKKELAYYICLDLGLICNYIDGDISDWSKGCHEVPRARGLCTKHFQKKYHKYVYDDDNNDKE